ITDDAWADIEKAAASNSLYKQHVTQLMRGHGTSEDGKKAIDRYVTEFVKDRALEATKKQVGIYGPLAVASNKEKLDKLTSQKDSSAEVKSAGAPATPSRQDDAAKARE